MILDPRKHFWLSTFGEISIFSSITTYVLENDYETVKPTCSCSTIGSIVQELSNDFIENKG